MRRFALSLLLGLALAIMAGTALVFSALALTLDSSRDTAAAWSKANERFFPGLESKVGKVDGRAAPAHGYSPRGVEPLACQVSRELLPRGLEPEPHRSNELAEADTRGW